MGRSAHENSRQLRTRPAGWVLGALVLALAGFAQVAPSASALILPPTTIDGPSTAGLRLGDVAMAADGTGGLVYLKNVEGVPHVFVSRYDNGGWSAPIRVDSEQAYEAGEPRIAAGRRGRLLVVWVTPVATVNGKIRAGLLSASLGPGASGFGPSLLVDSNVGEGVGVDPSLAGAAPGKAVVAYRVVTFNFGVPGQFEPGVQLRPGDVMADVRVARLDDDRWSRIGAVNRFPAASMRPPSETNGPEVAIGAGGRAVVAWQEPDLSGTARVLVRRVTGSTLGPVFAAGPETWSGRPVTDDATALGLDVTGFDMARVAIRVDGVPGSPLNGPRIFLTTFGSSYSAAGAEPVGPEPADGEGGAAPVGSPAVAASDEGGGEGSLRVAFASGGAVRLVQIDDEGNLGAPRDVGGPPAEPATPVVNSVDPSGGGVIAYEARDGLGPPAVAVRQEFPGGGFQTGLLFGPLGGEVSQLAGGGSGSGDALLAFRQGESGRFAVVAGRVAAPPAKFTAQVPKRWVRPRRARIRWPVAPSAVGGVRYAVVVDGRVVKRNLTRRKLTPRPAQLGSGVRRVQVLATDRLGQDVLTRPVKLRVDDRPPSLRVRVRRKRGIVVLKLRDPEAGLVRRATRVRFGDGEREHGGAEFRHSYAHPGRYTIRILARDRVNNRLARRIRLVVQ